MPECTCGAKMDTMDMYLAHQRVAHGSPAGKNYRVDRANEGSTQSNGTTLVTDVEPDSNSGTVNSSAPSAGSDETAPTHRDRARHFHVNPPCDGCGHMVCTYNCICAKCDEQQPLQAQLSDQPGRKFDAGKPRTDLLPVRPMLEEAKVLAHGAAKYGDRNWEAGFNWSRAYGALLRHLFAFWQGEDNDTESGLPHLAHARCCLDFLMEFSTTHKEYDDRPK